jgi:anti-anti-sigma regulatory factor
MGHLKPGFVLFVDMSNLESMDASCAPGLGAIMDLCNARGISTVVRVIPDLNKDIGLNLISHFHYHPKVKTQTYESLAEAIKSLLAEPLEASPMDTTST